MRELKNSEISSFTKKYINSKIKLYGKIINIKIDSKNKNIELEVLLKGEKENIFITIEKYEVVYKENSIKFENFTASREWIERLIKNVLIPKYVPINI